MMRAEALLRFATQQPDQHNLREAYRQMYVEMGVAPEKIELILAPERQKPRPLDPLTENQNAIVGMPLVAGAYQDHDAHIAAHAPIAQDNPILQAHINEHLAMKMRQQVEQVIGQPLPPPGMPLPPELENQLAVMVAQAMQQLAPMYKPQPEVDQMAQVEMQKLQLREADSQRDAQVEMAKAQMEAQTDAADRASREKIAAMKLQSEALRNLGGFQ
jgi:hypothetical protein